MSSFTRPFVIKSPCPTNTMKRPWILCNHLLAAIEKKDIENATQIIDGGFDVDSVILNGKSAISICIERGVTEIAQLLLKRGCSLSLKSPKGDYPLHLAVLKRDVNMVKMLLNHRADATCLNFLGQTPLHLACQINSFEIIKVLLGKNASARLKLVDRERRTPFMDACKHATKEIIEYLLPKSKVNSCDLYGENPLLQCIMNPNISVELLSLLLKAGANVQWLNYNGETPLLRVMRRLCHCRCATRNSAEKFIQIAILLIDYKSDLNVKNNVGQTPLHLAVTTSKDILVRKLLNAGSDVDAKDDMAFTPLFYAIRQNDKKLIDILIEGGSNVTSHDWTYVQRNLTMPYALELIEDIIMTSKQVKLLSTLCRIAIRKSCKHSVDEDVSILPIPPTVIKYIKLEE